MHAPLPPAKPLCRVVQGNCLDLLCKLPDNFIQCVVTSPPYWGLRDYKLPPTIWDGQADCAHEWGAWQEHREQREAVQSGKTRTTDRFYGEPTRKFSNERNKITAGSFCTRCNAWLGTHGLEPTYQLYLTHSVQIFREVRRVLRPDGLLWLNIGDSYASQGGDHSKYTNNQTNVGAKKVHLAVAADSGLRSPAPGLKPKDLCGIPWRLALALQEDGWYLRQDIIWHKPNPMPESVTDRCTKAHEYLFMLSKSPRYYFDNDAIREPLADKAGVARFKKGKAGKSSSEYEERKWIECTDGLARPPMTMTNREYHPLGRNARSVWTISTKPYPEAHFATFPPDLVTPCIKAGTAPNDLVLDPFAGSGTVGMVANQLNRHALLFEQSEPYIALIKKRCGLI